MITVKTIKDLLADIPDNYRVEFKLGEELRITARSIPEYVIIELPEKEIPEVEELRENLGCLENEYKRATGDYWYGI